MYQSVPVVNTPPEGFCERTKSPSTGQKRLPTGQKNHVRKSPEAPGQLLADTILTLYIFDDFSIQKVF